MSTRPDRDALYCSFCGKSQHEVWKLIAGPASTICDECVDLCTAIVADGRKTEAEREHKRATEAALTLGWTWPIPGDGAGLWGPASTTGPDDASGTNQ